MPQVNCYCAMNDHRDVLRDMVNDVLPDDALTSRCCWSTVCRVRALNFSAISDAEWQELCRRRGKLFTWT